MNDVQLDTGQSYSYADKIAQSHKEAKATVIALVLTIIAWVILGFGLAGVDLKIAGMPLWVLGGTVGTLVVTVLIVAVMNKVVFRDFSLDDDDAPEYTIANGDTHE